MEYRRELDGVRGVACLSVILLHTVIGAIDAETGSTYDTARRAVQPFLVGGVDLFFVLSGFLIGGILVDHKGAKNYFRTFWRRRIGRIFPVYYLMILILIGIHAVDWFYKSPHIYGLLYNQLPIWAYATFTQNFYMALEGTGGNFLGVSWSLAVEEQFYLLLPPLIFLLSRKRIVALAVMAIIAAPFIRTILWDQIDWRASYLLSPARMDTVMWGLLVACAVRNEKVIGFLSRGRICVDLLIISLAVLVAADFFNQASAPLLSTTTYYLHGLLVSTLRYSALAMMYGLIILRLFLPGAMPLKSLLSGRFLGRVGLVSYAAYMYHQLINFAVHRAAHGGNPLISTWSDAYLPVIVLGVTFLAAALSYHYLEKPILERARQKKYEFVVPSRMNTETIQTASSV